MNTCDDEVKQQLIDRLNRIEGQVRGVRKMMEDGRDCFEILKQVSAVSGAVRSFQRTILERHVASCLEGALADGRDRAAVIQELVKNLCALQ